MAGGRIHLAHHQHGILSDDGEVGRLVDAPRQVAHERSRRDRETPDQRRPIRDLEKTGRKT
jgi:hypothetical protein